MSPIVKWHWACADWDSRGLVPFHGTTICGPWWMMISHGNGIRARTDRKTIRPFEYQRGRDYLAERRCLPIIPPMVSEYCLLKIRQVFLPPCPLRISPDASRLNAFLLKLMPMLGQLKSFLRLPCISFFTSPSITLPRMLMSRGKELKRALTGMEMGATCAKPWWLEDVLLRMNRDNSAFFQLLIKVFLLQGQKREKNERTRWATAKTCAGSSTSSTVGTARLEWKRI